MRSVSRAAVYLTGMLSLAGGTSPLWADSRPYCEAFARDLANRKVLVTEPAYSNTLGTEGVAVAVNTSETASLPDPADNRLWRHIYGKALNNCLEQYPPAAAIKSAAPKSIAAKPEKPPVAVKRAAESAEEKGPKPGTAAWKKYCLAKHPSFNAETGTYRTFSGAQRKCEWTG